MAVADDCRGECPQGMRPKERAGRDRSPLTDDERNRVDETQASGRSRSAAARLRRHVDQQLTRVGQSRRQGYDSDAAVRTDAKVVELDSVIDGDQVSLCQQIPTETSLSTSGA